MQNPSKVCQQCQAPIPSDAPGGLCPACVLLGAAQPTAWQSPTLNSAPTVEEIAAAFPELEIRDVLGVGGMGIVFKARQPRLDRIVALKILPPSLAQQPGFAERFTREARALARLNHPNIVSVYDFGERAGYYYLLMEFVDGVNLRQAIRAGVKPEQALALVPRVCEALQFAHDHGVLHRDIKPENILLDTRGVPKLADFGIAKLAGDQTSGGLTLSGAQLGTAAYMAPEQIEKPGTVDHRADIYSLGVVLYEMLTGELPLGRFAPPSEKAHTSRGVDEVVFRALEKERDRRQQSATEMKSQVEHATLGGIPPHVPASTPGATLSAYRELPWSRAAAWGIVLVLAAIPLGASLYFIALQIVNPTMDLHGQLAGPPAGNIIIFGFLPALLGTALGWKAVSDVRYHRGYLRGGGSAVTAALGIPILAVVGTLVVNFRELKEEISTYDYLWAGTVFAGLIVAAGIAASVWAFRALWGFVHDGAPGVPVARRNASAAADGDISWSQIFRALTALSAVGIPVVAMLSLRFPRPQHMIAAVIVFGTLSGLANAFARERDHGTKVVPPVYVNPWPRRIFWMIAIVILVPVIALFAPMWQKVAVESGHKPAAQMGGISLENDAAPSWRMHENEQPINQALGNDRHAAYVVRSSRALAFVLWREGSFKSVNTHGIYDAQRGVWTDEYRVELPNGRVFEFFRASADPYVVQIGESMFDLRRGRVFVFNDDGVTQRSVQADEPRKVEDLPSFAAKIEAAK